MIPESVVQHARERLLNDTLVERRQPAETARVLRLERVALRLPASRAPWRALRASLRAIALVLTPRPPRQEDRHEGD